MTQRTRTTAGDPYPINRSMIIILLSGKKYFKNSVSLFRAWTLICCHTVLLSFITDVFLWRGSGERRQTRGKREGKDTREGRHSSCYPRAFFVFSKRSPRAFLAFASRSTPLLWETQEHYVWVKNSNLWAAKSRQMELHDISDKYICGFQAVLRSSISNMKKTSQKLLWYLKFIHCQFMNKIV